jgi:cytochrome c-type biogenesis protein CcmH
MMKYVQQALVLVLCFLSIHAFAVIETYDFSSDANQRRYVTFVEELRCPKCQNQNLSGSNSPIAADLRRELHRMIEAGEGDEQITQFMVQRYGNFVLYRPPLDKNTLVLWIMPGMMILLAFVVIIVYRRRLVKGDFPKSLLPAEQQALNNLLDQYPD